MSADNMLTLAASLTGEQVDNAAHALGWPDRQTLRRPWRTRWANPCRNYYVSGQKDCWEAMIALGLAQSEVLAPTRQDLRYSLTPTGIAVVRLRLQAEALSLRLGAASCAPVGGDE